MNPVGRCRTGRFTTSISATSPESALPERSVNGAPAERAVRTSTLT